MSDYLNDILSILRVSEADWSVLQMPRDTSLLCDEKEYLHVFVVLAGRAWCDPHMAYAGEVPVELSEGDIALSIGTGEITVRSGPTDTHMPERASDLPSEGVLPWFRIGEGAPQTMIAMGRLMIEPQYRAMLRRVTDGLLILRGETIPLWAGPLCSAHSLEAALKGMGGEAYGCRLGETCITQMIRGQDTCSGALYSVQSEAMMSPQITKAVKLINTHPATSWTVESLARAVGMSRSSFSVAFGKLTGDTPVRHLSRVRMKIAAQMLRNDAMTLIEIAHYVGYSNDISLIRAFKRFFRMTPSEFRRCSEDGANFDWLEEPIEMERTIAIAPSGLRKVV